jgi:small GTP-binding protein
VLKRKICIIGEFGVGKTSLTQRFVNDAFSDEYLTTIGVKIDSTLVGDTKVIVWDIAWPDSLSRINANYLAGAAGIVLVGDGTRACTVADLSSLWQVVVDRIGEVPMVIALNKSDDDKWQLSERQIDEFRQRRWQFFDTSAKTGKNVQQVFKQLLAKFE